MAETLGSRWIIFDKIKVSLTECNSSFLGNVYVLLPNFFSCLYGCSFNLALRALITASEICLCYAISTEK